MTHKITIVRGSAPESMGYMDWRQNVCECGWKGRKYYNYENYTWSNCTAEADTHIFKQREIDRATLDLPNNSV